MDASLIIRFVTQGLEQVERARRGLGQLREASQELGRSFTQTVAPHLTAENYERAMGRAERAAGRARAEFVGWSAALAAFAAPLRGVGTFEERLVQFGNTAQIGRDQLQQFEDRLRSLAPDLGRSASELLTGLEFLVGKGLDPSVALEALEAVGRTATATGAVVDDIAAASFSSLNNLQVPVEDLQLALDIMAQAGKQGGFELADMARHFPGLTASARALGMNGTRSVAELAAALQVATDGAQDGAAAATNLQNFLSKITSPEAIRNFEELGVSVEDELARAAESGISAFEHMLAVIQEVTGGDPIAIGDIFGDMQVQAFLRPMLANMERYRAIRDQALAGEGTVAVDFANNMDTLNARLREAGIHLDNIRSNGRTLLPLLKGLFDTINGGLEQFNQFASANPEMAQTLLTGLGAMLALGVAIKGVQLVSLLALKPLLSLAKAFLLFDSAGKNISVVARALRGLGSAGAGLGGLMARLGGLRAFLKAGAILSIGFMIADDWGRTPEERLERIQRNWDAWRRRTREVEDSGFGQMWQRLRARVNEGLGLEADAIPADALANWVRRLGENAALEAQRIGDALVAKLLEISNRVQAWIDSLFAGLRERFTIDLDINWPEPPAWVTRFFGGGPSEPRNPRSSRRDRRPDGLPDPETLSSGLESGSPGDPITQDVQARIHAEVIDRRPPQVTVNADITINEASDGQAIAGAVQREIGAAVSSAMGGAAHGGTD